jgi:AraC-like DNA-binding protein
MAAHDRECTSAQLIQQSLRIILASAPRGLGVEKSLAEIASRVGFKHVEYLTFVFKRECGLPPSAYREQRV